MQNDLYFLLEEINGRLKECKELLIKKSLECMGDCDTRTMEKV